MGANPRTSNAKLKKSKKKFEKGKVKKRRRPVYDSDLSVPQMIRLPSVPINRNKASASRSLELVIIMLPTGGNKPATKIRAARAVAISPFSSPSNFEIANTENNNNSTAASL